MMKACTACGILTDELYIIDVWGRSLQFCDDCLEEANKSGFSTITEVTSDDRKGSSSRGTSSGSAAGTGSSSGAAASQASPITAAKKRFQSTAAQKAVRSVLSGRKRPF